MYLAQHEHVSVHHPCSAASRVQPLGTCHWEQSGRPGWDSGAMEHTPGSVGAPNSMFVQPRSSERHTDMRNLNLHGYYQQCLCEDPPPSCNGSCRFPATRPSTYASHMRHISVADSRMLLIAPAAASPPWQLAVPLCFKSISPISTAPPRPLSMQAP